MTQKVLFALFFITCKLPELNEDPSKLPVEPGAFGSSGPRKSNSVIPVHDSNAQDDIDVTLGEITIFFKSVQPSNADGAIDRTLFSIITASMFLNPKLLHFSTTLVDEFLISVCVIEPVFDH